MKALKKTTRPSTLRPNVRPRLHRLYYVLAVFDLLTVSFSLYLMDLVTTIYTDSVAINETWAIRLGDFLDLSDLGAAVNAPGNEVFDTRDVVAENQSLTEALREFQLKADAVRQDLELITETGLAQKLLPQLDEAEVAMTDMVSEAHLIFSYFRTNQPDRAGERMAEMDRRYAHLTKTLALLSRNVHNIQRSLFETQAEETVSVRKFEFVIAGLIVLMVTAVTFYGHTLARRMKAAALQAEEHLAALADREARIRAIVETASDGIVTVGDDGDIESANAMAGSIFGYSIEELIGREVSTLFPSFKSEAVLAEVRNRPRQEVDGRRLDGSIFPTDLAVSDTGLSEQGFTTWIIRDITVRKQTEAELLKHQEHLESLIEERTHELEESHEQLRLVERLASIGTLAAGLGHDMNNVLFPVRCRLDTLNESDLDDEVRDELDAIHQSIKYLQQLSDGLRLLALDPDDPLASSGITHLNTWLEESRPLFITALPKQARLVCELPKNLPALSVAPHRLTQAVFNLVSNAGDAIIDIGTVHIVAKASEDQRFVSISVTDDGQGMSAEVRRQALDPFFTTKTRGLSTGLGLALVQGVAKSSGGTVEIISTEKRGTTVTLTLPTAKTAHAFIDKQTGRPVRATVSLSDQRMATFVAAILKAAGYDVSYARSNDSCEGVLWIIDDSEQSMQAARQFINRRSNHQVIVFGDPGPQWSKLGAIPVPAIGGLDAIQEAVIIAGEKINGRNS